LGDLIGSEWRIFDRELIAAYFSQTNNHLV